MWYGGLAGRLIGTLHLKKAFDVMNPNRLSIFLHELHGHEVTHQSARVAKFDVVYIYCQLECAQPRPEYWITAVYNDVGVVVTASADDHYLLRLSKAPLGPRTARVKMLHLYGFDLALD
jgi:lipocalin